VIAADKVAVGRRSAETRNAADGTAVTEESARGVTVGDGSFAYAGSHTRKNAGADGKDGAQSQSHTVIGLGKEGVTGSHGMTHKNADGETTGAFSVAGGVNLKDGVAANGQIAAQAGPISVSMGGGITITADAPVEKAGTWHVAYRKSVNVGGALGAEAGGVGASANLSRTVVDGGVRVFATRDEALAFRKDVAAQVGAETDVTRAEAVRAIPVGETRSHAVLEAGGAGVKGKASVVDLGAHVQAQDSKTIEVKRLSKDLVEVSITRGDGLGGGGSAGAGPAKLEVGAHQKTSHRMTFTYDLSTADGRDDYETLLRTGIPILRTASFVDSQHESERGVRGGASLGPVASGEGASVTRDSEKRDAGDNRVQTYEGERRDTSGLLGSSTVDRTVLSGVEVNDKERSFTVTREIESNRGAAVADRLGETYGVSGDGANLRRKASGKWQVGTAISDPQMQGFIARAEAGALSGLGGGDLNVTARRAVLVKELAAAGSSDEKMKALARYTADLGPQAIADMEAIIDWGVDEKGAKKGPQRDLTLEGDKVWNGARFRTETEARAQKLQQALAAPGADRGNVAAQAADALGELRERRLLLRDQTRYADLPDELRAAEIDRTESFIRRFEDLRAAATARSGRRPWAPMGSRDRWSPPTPASPGCARSSSEGRPWRARHRGSTPVRTPSSRRGRTGTARRTGPPTRSPSGRWPT
jgi:hypothetical protein